MHSCPRLFYQRIELNGSTGQKKEPSVEAKSWKTFNDPDPHGGFSPTRAGPIVVPQGGVNLDAAQNEEAQTS